MRLSGRELVRTSAGILVVLKVNEINRRLHHGLPRKDSSVPYLRPRQAECSQFR